MIWIDLVIVGALLLGLGLGAKRGFLQTLGGVAATVVSFIGAGIAAGAFSGTVAKWIRPLLEKKMQSGGISGRAISDGDSAGIVPDEDTGALTLPEAVRGLRIAHCYIADGGELPELDGKLLYSDSSAAWFQLDNNMSTLQNTLNALEKSGCTVTAYEDIGLTLDSRADSWLLIVRN